MHHYYPSLFIAYRYIQNSGSERTIRILSFICLASIIIGTTSMCLVAAIMQGFEEATYEKIQSIHPDIIIEQSGEKLNVPSLAHVLQEEFPTVLHYSPMSTHYAMLEPTDGTCDGCMITLKGIDSLHHAQTTHLERYLHPQTTLLECLDQDKIIIGHKLAHALRVQVGDPIQLIYFPVAPTADAPLSLETATVVVGGFMRTGIDDVDEAVVYAPQRLIDHLFPDDGITTVGIKLHPDSNQPLLIEQLRTRFGLNVRSWHEGYAALMAALKLEKYAMLLLLGLFVIVASLSCASLLVAHIQFKKTDAALLYSMGMQPRQVRVIFYALQAVLTGMGCILGVTLAWLVATFFHHYPCITLPDSYYVSTLPIALTPTICSMSVLFVVTICTITSCLASRALSFGDAATLLR